MPFFETSLLEFHRGAKKRKKPKTPKAQLSDSNSPEVELQARETEKHAVKQELRILFQYALIKVFCKSAVFPTATWSSKNCGFVHPQVWYYLLKMVPFKGRLLYLPNTTAQGHFQASCVQKSTEVVAQDSGKLVISHGFSFQHVWQNKCSHSSHPEPLGYTRHTLWQDLLSTSTAFHLAGLSMINEHFKTLNLDIKYGLACLVATCVSLKWS